ncbi:restriction endonuclease subunit S [Yoonia sp. R78084]|uniref:restriction endonuclease subunit S n=1 Tax=Yoonia sp. R78084 TaxID=3093869 RepID=UPI0037DC3DBB
MSYAPYPAYKDSGVPWLGQVPDGWEVKPVKYVSTFNDEALPETTDPELMLNYVDISSVSLVEGIKKIEQVEFEKAPSRARRVVREGDTIVSTVRTYLKAIAPIRNPVDNMIVSTGFAVIRPDQTMNPDFLGYFIQSEGFVGEVVSKSTGVSYPAINPGDLVAISGVRPPVEEQTAIADFLDKKTAEIDDLIAKKEELLRLLAEQRTALITHAVTKGLNPNAPMKPSGIGWIGDVPEGWSVAPIGYRYEVQLGRMLNAERADGEHLRPYLRVLDVQWGSINTKDLPRMDFPPEAQARYRLQKGDLLVNEGGSYVGRSAIWRGELEECFYQKALHRVRPLNPRKDSTEFLLLLMEVATKLGVFVAGGNQTTIDHLTAEKLRAQRFPFPPFKEQIRIADEVRKKAKRMAETASKINQALENLREYRSAVITNAVTGKIKVA